MDDRRWTVPPRIAPREDAAAIAATCLLLALVILAIGVIGGM